MTTTTLPELKVCPLCDGSGEISTGRREAATNAPIHIGCWFCDSEGRVDADADLCTVCEQPLEAEEACRHGQDTLCRGCAYRCLECADNAHEQAAEEWVSALREAGGFR